MPTTPYQATLQLSPPAVGAPPTGYTAQLCTTKGAGACVTAPCPASPAPCTVRGLAPSTTYTATAVGRTPAGATPPSSVARLTTPPLLAPALTLARPEGPPTAFVQATSPPELKYTTWEFRAVPLGGGPTVVATAYHPEVVLGGLQPSTPYDVTLRGVLPDGRRSPPSNTLTFQVVTPALG